MEIALVALLTLLASGVGTLTGFGTSTIMVPVLLSFLPLPEALLFVGILHWFGDVWKIALFRKGIDLGLIVRFGVPGLIATVFGGMLVFVIDDTLLLRVLGGALLGYVLFLLLRPGFRLPQSTVTALAGGTAYGVTAGLFGIGGAVRGAFLAAFDLPKAVYIATAGAIGLAVDTGRLITYWVEGARIDERLLWGLLLFVPVSFVGAKLSERIVDRIPQSRFRTVISLFLLAIAVKLLLFPSAPA